MSSKKLADGMSYPPRAFRADRAAAYLSISQAAFLKLVDEGLMPAPIKIKGMTTWDRLELDAAYESFKEPEVNTIHQILGITS